MKKTLALLLLFNTSAIAQTPGRHLESELGDIIARVVAPLISPQLNDCKSGNADRLPFYYGGTASFTLSPDIQNCLTVIPRDSFPSRKPYQDGFRGRILTLNGVHVQDSVARVSATYYEISGPYPQFRNYGRGASVEFRKRSGKWVETDRVEGTT